MKAKRIQIERAAHLSLIGQFIDDLVAYSSCTEDGYIVTVWALDGLNEPFIETTIRWDHYHEDRSDAEITYFLYVPQS